ncbi:iron-containing alcohol dehydrogenase family protein [Oceanibacterium hippocampi]|uniref:NAD-dependent methanol dehydrogenase n=1 Tax=Oceanibacterium hippocampi TaxID=745714 RepID=A0A1Y5SDU1_9PROT|nr:iron-containing alcohol dehydrogenase [Oceanibacterium hippocampi]SLN38312.1 NAD-dependent methanol dehydrogenase [Oceanibacterium hippocampi]
MILDRFYNRPGRTGFHYPGRMLSGPGTRNEVPGLLVGLRTLVVADRFFAADPLIAELAFDRLVLVDGEPTDAAVEKAAASLPADCGAIVALGGGSAIDTAKALHATIVWGSHAIHDPAERPEQPLLVAIPTTAGTGSEASRFYVLKGDDGAKKSFRAWGVTPHLAVLDPHFLQQAPKALLVGAAFDSFLHLWETFVCRGERSPATDMLALDGIPKIVQAIGALLGDEEPSNAALGDLQQAAWAGGVAISNVRTGLAHTLAESLAGQVALGHPETLYVFFPVVLASYRDAVDERMTLLARHLGPGWDHDRLTAFWHDAFTVTGLARRTCDVMRNTPIDPAAVARAAARDTVLLKENPMPLKPEDLDGLIDRALAPYRVGEAVPA